MMLNTYLNMRSISRDKGGGARVLLVGIVSVLVYFMFLTLVALVASIVVTTNAIDTEYFLAHKDDFRTGLGVATGFLFLATLLTHLAYLNVIKAKRYRKRIINVPLCYLIVFFSLILGAGHGTLHILIGLGSYNSDIGERDDYPAEPRSRRDRYEPRDDYRRRPPRDERRRRSYDDEY